MRVEETEAGYSLDEFLPDVMVGALAVVFIVVTALLLGGFSFFAPWLIVSPLAMLMAGLLRARSVGNIWLKCLAICLVAITLAALFVRPLAGIGIVAPLLIMPCATGIWLRRRERSVSSEPNPD